MKKAFSSLIASIFVLSTFVFPASALSVPEPEFFSDVQERTPNSSAIEYLKNNKVINGYSDGSFKPGNTINRAEFITIIMNSISDNLKDTNCFPDVKEEWFAGAACAAKNLNIIDGYENGNFEGNRNINLAEASKIISNAYDLDLGQGSNWFEPFIRALEGKKAIPISIDSLDKKLSRSEVAEMIYRIKDKKEDKSSKTLDSLIAEIPRIGSCIELQEKIATHQYRNNYYYDYGIDDEMSILPTMEDGFTGGAEESAPSPEGVSNLFKKESKLSSDKPQSASDYSNTNIQVVNVDESDVVKNNGSHIYFIQDRAVKVVKAYPADEMAELATISPSANFSPQALYLNGDQLIITGSDYNYFTSRSQVHIYIYDVSNPQSPFQSRLIKFDGREISSRRVGDNLYLVLNQYQPYYYYNHHKSFSFGELGKLREGLPHFYDSEVGQTERVAECDDIMYFPGHRSVDYLIVAGIPLDSKEKSVNRSLILGGTENVYSTTDSLYVANTEYHYSPFEIYDSWDEPSNTHYQNTRIHRFSLNNGKIKLEDKGFVPGRILNQFAMDEYEDSFRIATTINDAISTNNLYVLDKDKLSNITGEIEDIAPGEQIYSTRFMGDKTYMVTFKTTDPFFVIDTSDPYNPHILGKLKIPGYSNYLHPYDEDHIIGIGKEAVESKSGDFAWYQGMKVALYNVKDVKNPREVSNITIGDRGSESEVLRNHRALLFSKEKGFMAFPVLEAHLSHVDSPISPDSASNYGEYTFQGAHVYNISTNKGLSLRGKITHHTEDHFLKSGSYWYGNDSDIKRIIYIGDNFYTISNDRIKATDMDSMKEQNSIKVNGTKLDEPEKGTLRELIRDIVR